MDFPFYFPVSVLLLDDDQDVLDATSEAFTYLLPGRNVYTMSRARDAVKFVASHALTFNSFPKDVDFDSTTAQVEAKFEQKHGTHLDTLERHRRQVGVVITDFAMPDMTGIEFCRRLAGRSIPKILLTGKVTQEDALKAFNDGLIDRYVPKQHADALNILRDYVLDLEAQFFQRANRQVEQLIGAQALPYFGDARVVQSLHDLCGALRVTMRAPCFAPPGLLVATATGERFLLAVVNMAYLASAIEIAEVDRLPAEVIRLMERRTHVYLPDLEQGAGAELPYPSVHPMIPLAEGAFYTKLPL